MNVSILNRALGNMQKYKLTRARRHALGDPDWTKRTVKGMRT